MSSFRRLFQSPYFYLTIVLIGLSLKFYKLNEQFFWDDEVCTVLHTSGISMDSYEKAIPVNQIFPKQYFEKQLQLKERHLSLRDQLTGLMEMPQVTPGHYYYFIFLTRIFGDDFRLYRYFSLVVFLLSVPFLFLLTRRVFQSELAAWMATSLYAVSPFFQQYSQEARYYALWGLMVILMHYLFVVAIEKRGLKWWALYVFIGFFAIHTTIMVYVSLLAHFIFAAVYYRKQLKAVALSQFLIFLTSLPWLIFIYINRQQIIEGLAWQQGMGALSATDSLAIQSQRSIESFVYFYLMDFPGWLDNAAYWVYGILLLAAIAVFFWKATPRQRLFVGLIAFLGVLVILLIDLIRGSSSAYVPRYLLANFIGLYVLISFSAERALRKWPVPSGLVFLLIVGVGLWSSVKVAQDVALGKRADAYYHVRDAQERFSGNERTLIISDFSIVVPKSYSAIMALTHLCKDEHIDLIYAKPDFPNFKTDFDLSEYDKVYAMYLSPELLDQLKANFAKDELKELEERVIYGRFDVSLYEIDLAKGSQAQNMR